MVTATAVGMLVHPKTVNPTVLLSCITLPVCRRLRAGKPCAVGLVYRVAGFRDVRH